MSTEDPRRMSRPDYTLVLSAEAQDDLEDIFSYTLQTWGLEQLSEYSALINSTLAAIADNPNLGHSRPEIESRYRCLGAGHHLIFYRVGEATVYVVRILYGRMDVSRHLRDTPP